MSRFKRLTLILPWLLATSCETRLAATRWGGPADSGPDVRDASQDADEDAEGQSSDAGTCRRTVVDLTLPKGSVMLLLERSNAMNTLSDANCSSCGTYWTMLLGAVDALTSAKSNQFRWGLKLFPSPDAVDMCSSSSVVDVPIAAEASGAIASALRSVSPSGGTPASTAIRTTFEHFDSLPDDDPQIVLLAMGSTPACASGDPKQEDFQATIEVLSRMTEPAVFVLGFGSERQKFDRLAAAGATFSAYAPEETPRLLREIEDWARTIANCTFALPAPVRRGQSLDVLLDDVRLTLDDPDGFTLSPDGKQLTILGSGCFAIGSYAALTIQMGC